MRSTAKRMKKLALSRLSGIDGKPLSHLQMKLVLECFETPSSVTNGFFLRALLTRGRWSDAILVGETPHFSSLRKVISRFTSCMRTESQRTLHRMLPACIAYHLLSSWIFRTTTILQRSAFPRHLHRRATPIHFRRLRTIR